MSKDKNENLGRISAATADFNVGRIGAATEGLNMGRIGAAHGIKGSLRIKSYTANPLDLGKYGPLSDKNGNLYTVKNIRPQKTMVIVRFKEITSRDQAEPLNGTELFIAPDKMPVDLPEEEFYLKDLLGLDVRDADNQMVGTIIDIQNFGAGDLLEISPKPTDDGASKPSYFLAFTKSNVPEIDLNQRFVKVLPPIEVSEKDIEGEPEQNEL